MQALIFLEDEFHERQSEGNARFLEIAWQLCSDHILMVEGPKIGSWRDVIVPALECCKRQLSLEQLLSADIEALTSEQAFVQYGKG